MTPLRWRKNWTTAPAQSTQAASDSLLTLGAALAGVPDGSQRQLIRFSSMAQDTFTKLAREARVALEKSGQINSVLLEMERSTSAFDRELFVYDDSLPDEPERHPSLCTCGHYDVSHTHMLTLHGAARGSCQVDYGKCPCYFFKGIILSDF